MAKRSLLRNISIAAAVVFLGPPIGFFALRKRLAARTWTRFAACLAGPRIPETGSAEVRVRRVGESVAYTAAAALPWEQRWPYRCADLAHELASSRAVRSVAPELEQVAQVVEGELGERVLMG